MLQWFHRQRLDSVVFQVPNDETTSSVGGCARALEAVRGAALHCIALDETGSFSPDSILGVFEVPHTHHAARDPSRIRSLEIMGGEVELVFPHDEGPRGALSIRISLMIRLSAHSGQSISSGTSPLKQLDGVDPGDTDPPGNVPPTSPQLTIALLACWNLVTSDWTSNLSSLRVEVSAAFGTQGHWYAAEEVVALHRSPDESHAASPGLVSDSVSYVANFDWRPEGGIRYRLEDPVVADLRVSTEEPSSSAQTDFMFHGTLCKRSGGTRDVRATITPQGQQLLTREIMGSVKAGSTLGVPSGYPADDYTWDVQEVNDPEWTQEAVRGMEAVEELPRLPEWTTEQWRERMRRRRQRRAEEERVQQQESRRRGRGDTPGHWESARPPVLEESGGLFRRAGRSVERWARKIRTLFRGGV